MYLLKVFMAILKHLKITFTIRFVAFALCKSFCTDFTYYAIVIFCSTKFVLKRNPGWLLNSHFCVILVCPLSVYNYKKFYYQHQYYFMIYSTSCRYLLCQNRMIFCNLIKKIDRMFLAMPELNHSFFFGALNFLPMLFLDLLCLFSDLISVYKIIWVNLILNFYHI